MMADDETRDVTLPAQEVTRNGTTYALRKRTKKADIKLRIEEAEKLIAEGATLEGVARAMRDQYGVTYRTAKGWAEKAVDSIVSANDGIDTVRRKAMWRRRLERLYFKAYQSKKYAAATAAARQCLLLDGVIDSSGNVVVVVGDVNVDRSTSDGLLSTLRRMAATRVIDVEAREDGAGSANGRLAGEGGGTNGTGHNGAGSADDEDGGEPGSGSNGAGGTSGTNGHGGGAGANGAGRANGGG